MHQIRPPYRLIGPVMMFCLLLAACGGDEDSDRPGFDDRGPIPSVEVIQARLGALPLEERLSGIVRADNQVAIHPEISAPIVRVVAQNGDRVEAGQPLVYLRDTPFREQLRQAEAALEVARADARRTEAALRELEARLERTRQLVEKQYQSRQELEALQAQVEAARAAHEQALARIAQAEASVGEQQEALRRTVVRAPISGQVGQRNAEVGMRVDPGTRLFTIGNFDRVRVEVAIPDEVIHHIEVGQTALITLNRDRSEVIEAAVSRISPFLEEGSFSAGAEIDVPNEDGLLRPGMFVTVDILYGESEQATLLPASALYEDPTTGALGVFVAPSLRTETPLEPPETYDERNPPPLTEPTPMQFQEVTVLARGRGLVGVSGVPPGAWVVSVGQHLLSGRGQGQIMARARPQTWERLLALQSLQDQDLLRQFMEKHQRLARDIFNDATPAASGDPTAAPAAVVSSPPPRS
ncbi:efflux RND transporter periplasmic adaptor subunit [Rhodocaloribacter litoris]|uniref:efflux RND transporter periplasmic adaptor subunit n=1 Tax=Rhodocaloribacter litoris TaxID=2558931 RepID=UPI001422A685|nr:efflux RND transporter periplasmic adaptor subunit [Rhodocaloribacter litoris]QXD14676.1 efflux RND transporter periplasmic adaptor subunit [Rhodocaloribacter litoris]